MTNNTKTYPVNVFQITDHDIDSVSNCLRDGWISGDSPVVDNFEKKFAEKIGAREAIAVSNGSIALDLAFHLIDLKPGDEVILPTFTIASCLFPILRAGAIPVFVDCDIDTWNMKSEDAVKKISKKTKAILIVHIYGLATDLETIITACKERNIFVIEDCAEAHGLKYKNQFCGTYGDIATYSFYANKAITTGEGGMLIIKNQNLSNKARKVRNLSFEPGRRFIHKEIGWNYRLSSLQAALGLSQIERLELNNENRKKTAMKYRENLSGIQGMKWQPTTMNNSDNCFWVNAAVLDYNIYGKANKVAEKLNNLGIQTRPFFYPLHLQSIVQERFGISEHLPNSEYISEQGLYFPSGNGLTIEMVNEISEIILSVLKS